MSRATDKILTDIDPVVSSNFVCLISLWCIDINQLQYTCMWTVSHFLGSPTSWRNHTMSENITMRWIMKSINYFVTQNKMQSSSSLEQPWIAFYCIQSIHLFYGHCTNPSMILLTSIPQSCIHICFNFLQCTLILLRFMLKIPSQMF